MYAIPYITLELFFEFCHMIKDNTYLYSLTSTSA